MYAKYLPRIDDVTQHVKITLNKIKKSLNLIFTPSPLNRKPQTNPSMLVASRLKNINKIHHLGLCYSIGKIIVNIANIDSLI